MIPFLNYGLWNYTQRTIADLNKFIMLNKKISNDQELIPSDPISCPQNQKGNLWQDFFSPLAEC